MRAVASEMIGFFVCPGDARYVQTNRGTRRDGMRKYLAGLAMFGLFGASGMVLADDRPKGPEEDVERSLLWRALPAKE